MAYNLEHLSKLAALKVIAEKLYNDYATKQAVEGLNIRITALEALKIPSNVSVLNYDIGFQSKSEVDTIVATAIAASGHAHFEIVETVPTAELAQENIMYLVMNDITGHYDIYALVDGAVVQLDDTTVDLTNYTTLTDLNDAVTELNNKIAEIDISGSIAAATATDQEVTAMLDEVFNGTTPPETTPVTPTPSTDTGGEPVADTGGGKE